MNCLFQIDQRLPIIQPETNTCQTISHLKNFKHMALFLGVLLFLISVGGCASTQRVPLSNDSKIETLDQKEKQLWKDCEKVEKEINSNISQYKGREEAESYLNEILDSLISNYNNLHLKPSIKIIGNPDPNAFAFPNGAIYVNTGLIALLDNEAQLASVVAHEFCHFKYRHTFRERIKVRNVSLRSRIIDMAATVAVGALTGVVATGMTGSIQNDWMLSSISGYSQELEYEADHKGLILYLDAGYEPSQAIQAFEALSRYNTENTHQTSKLSTHPRIEERIESYNKILNSPEFQGSSFGDKTESKRYNDVMFNVILRNAQLNIEMGNEKTALINIQRCLELDPENADSHFYHAEIKRRYPQENNDIFQEPLISYKKAIQCNKNHADSYREVGLLYRYAANVEKSNEYLQMYIDLKKDSNDIPIINSFLNNQIMYSDGNQQPHDPPLIYDGNMHDRPVYRIGMMPFKSLIDIPEFEKRRNEFETELTDILRNAGIEVIPSSEYEKIQEKYKTTMTTYLSSKGKKSSETTQRTINKFIMKEYFNVHRLDALVSPIVAVVPAKWTKNNASWDGVSAPTTGKTGFWADMNVPNAHGTIPALSFIPYITDAYGNSCYNEAGGIQLYKYISGNTFKNVPNSELLADSRKNNQGIHISCQKLFRELNKASAKKQTQ